MYEYMNSNTLKRFILTFMIFIFLEIMILHYFSTIMASHFFLYINDHRLG